MLGDRPALAPAPRRGPLLATLCLVAAASTPSRGGEPPAPAPAASESEVELAVARAARPGVVRIRWESPPPERETVERNAVVVQSDGTLLMAGPPPDAAGMLSATLAGGLEAPVQVVASDAASALVLLRAKVPADDLPTLTFAPSPRGAEDPLPPGSRVVMVTGTGAIARGAIRAHDRRTRVRRRPGDPTVELTCLDEAALPALAEDMGSPWLDAEGRVVGLLLSGAPAPEPSGGEGVVRVEPGVSYGIPAAVANVVWPLLRDHHVVDRARLGVHAVRPSDALEAHVCPSCGGIVVEALEPGGPAESAGILRYDLITALEGRSLRREEALHDALLPFRPGDRLRVTVLRKGERLEKTVLLGAVRSGD